MKRKLLLLVVAAAVIASLVIATTAWAAGPQQFNDVPSSNPAHDAIGRLVEQQIIEGFGDGTFRPDAPVIRQQMAKIMVLAFGNHTEAIDNQGQPTFPDVTPALGTPYPFDFVEEAVAAGFFQGGDDGLFHPQANISRVQLVLVLVRAGGSELLEPPADYDTGFTDVPSFATTEVAKAKFNGILDLAGGTQFDPFSAATRGEVAIMLDHLLLKLVPVQLDPAVRDAALMVREGRQIFRFDTFGDEAFWTGALQLEKAIEGEANGGVGPGVSPKTALSVGLKVDEDALPPAVLRALAAGKVNLDDPAVTLTLLKLNAVVGVKGTFNDNGSLKSIGIQCALCHSRVDDALGPGIGHRLDGWSNQDLNVGAIVSLAPNLQAAADFLGTDVNTVKEVLAAWGPGKFDAELFLDGKGFRPDGKSAATLIPPAFGLAGVNLHTWTGWGSVTYWNAFVANLEMHGLGTFFDPRLNDEAKFPVAVKNHLFDVRNAPDLITPKLPALHFYQLALKAPAPPAGSFDAAAAARGATLFSGKAMCASCHVEPVFTEPGWNLHTAEEIGIDSFQADRSPDGRYRTTPLKGLWTHTARGFYHDGRFPTLLDVINHYNVVFKLNLSDPEKTDLVEYLKSI